MVDNSSVLEFYNNRRVLITGNTGFKGSWLTFILLLAGARVTGYSCNPPTTPSLYNASGLDRDSRLKQVVGDIRDFNRLTECLTENQPEIVFHLAAQPIVRESYKNPVETYSTNVMGTVNICEAVKRTASVRSLLNVTTDKVYKESKKHYGYIESDELNGLDPYSNSKSCSELVTFSYNESYFKKETDCSGKPTVRVSTARAGNVIGGGDFSKDRIIPDCIRAAVNNSVINVRNPFSIRPYQHVLEPLFAYLMIAAKQYKDNEYTGCYNVGPGNRDYVTTGELVTLFCENWNMINNKMPDAVDAGSYLSWINTGEKNAPHEAEILKLDCSKIKKVFGWQPKWNVENAIRKTVDWTNVWLKNGDIEEIRSEMNKEIKEYCDIDI